MSASPSTQSNADGASIQAQLPDAEQIGKKVRIEEMRALFERSPSATILATVFAFGMAWEMRHDVAPMVIVAWLSAKCLIALPRTLHALQFRRRKDDSIRWLYQFRWLIAVDTLIWGTAAFALMPRDRAGATTLSALLAAFATISTFNVQSDWKTCRNTVVTIIVPLIVATGTRFDEFGLFLAASLAIYGYFLYATARRSTFRMRETLTLRFTNASLNKALSTALETLRIESSEKDGFMASMSHELRTPLHGMLGLARTLGADARERDKPHLNRITKSGNHLLEIINNILEFSKFNAHGVDIETDVRGVDVIKTIEEGIAICDTAAQEKGVELTIRVATERPLIVSMDPYRLRQVIVNLVGNAVKFTEPGGRVRVVVTQSKSGTELVITIKDSGIGMDRATMKKIFRPFVQADISSTRRYGGTGLGLSITKAICLKLGGDVTCVSTVGEGSVFTVRLPIVRVEGGNADREGADSRRGGLSVLGDTDFGDLRSDDVQMGVLLAEDNEVNAIVGEAALSRLGIKVTLVDNGLSVVKEMCTTSQRPELVLLDCQMPQMDGYDAARAIRVFERAHGLEEVPIVALTASVFQADREQCRAAGMNAFLSKPFTDSELRAVLAMFKVVPAEEELTDSMYASLAL